jgi:integrase/recombinase XerD
MFTHAERLALAGFLAGYSGLTRGAYELGLRQCASWCQQHQVRLLAARRADIECLACDLEARGRARATITRRLCTVPGWIIESRASGLDRNQLGALLAAAGPGQPAEQALISLLTLDEVRGSEATGANIEDLNIERAIAPCHHSQGQQGHHHPARATHRPDATTPG